MHALSKVRIVNYKSCVDTSLDLAASTPLVGVNNGGKSNVLKAIKWLVRPTALSSDEFNDPKSPLWVEGTISGITGEVLDGLEESHRTKIEPLCIESSLELRRFQSAPSRTVKDVSLQVRDAESGEWKNAPTGIPPALNALFPEPIEIGAMEDAAEDAAKYKTTTTIGRLIGDIVGPVQDEHGEALRHELEGLRAKLSADGKQRPKQMTDFDEGANAVLRTFFPDVTIRLHVPTPEVDDLFKSGTIKAYELDGPPRDIAALGHGAQRAIQMALVRYLADRSSTTSGSSVTKLLIVDEPELYLHPHGVEQVRDALKRLSKAGYQVLFATHSPLMISQSDVPDTLLVRKTKEKGTEARETLRGAVQSAMQDHPSQAALLFSLSNSSQILFSDHVVLAEGTTELRLIPSIFELVQGRTLGIAKIALINQGGVDSTPNSLRILSAMGLPSKAVVDLDFAFRKALSEGLVAEDDSDIMKCKEVLADMSASGLCNLGESGLPKKGGQLTSKEVFAELAQREAAVPCIESLHSKLLKEGIWLWTRGAMDNHVGLQSKSEEAWNALVVSIEKEGLGALPDEGGIRQFIEWMDERA